MTTQLHYGGVPVPYTVTWTGEQGHFLGYDQNARPEIPSLMQRSAPGEGKPRFGDPHFCRQREAMAKGLCDLCGKPLRASTKVSLSHARPRVNGADAFDILQVEPLLHRACARISVNHCPSLKRDIDQGTLMIRQVFRHRVQLAIISPDGTEELTGERRKSFGYAKVQLLKWRDRDWAWLDRGGA